VNSSGSIQSDIDTGRMPTRSPWPTAAQNSMMDAWFACGMP
jgi:hypothetical protein